MDPRILAAAGLIVLGYLSGSIPMGVIAAKLSGGPDPRTIGSGRTGGTNALRALGRRWAAFVAVGDVAKGAVPVLLTVLLGFPPIVQTATGLAAVLGAARSIFLRFHGGRGIATGVGTMLVIQPFALLIALPVFVVVIAVTRYVSLGSLVGSAAIFPATWLVFLVLNGSVEPIYLGYVLIGIALIWWAHADNIQRLLNGTERKFDFGLLAGRRGATGG